jgi:hypothetical protein
MSPADNAENVTSDTEGWPIHASTTVPNFTNPSQRIYEEGSSKLPLNKPGF